MLIMNLGLHVATHYKRQWNNGKQIGNWVPFEWKYWMTFHAIWLEFKFNSIKNLIDFNPNSNGFRFNKFELKFLIEILKIWNWIEIYWIELKSIKIGFEFNWREMEYKLM